MTDHDDLARLLRSALPPMPDRSPSRDLWPDVLRRTQARTAWTWLDFCVAALVLVALAMSPEWLWFLAYHL